MKRKILTLSITISCFLLSNGFLAIVCYAQSSRKAFESYYLKIGSFPEDATHDWNPNGVETQGVTHDDNDWYFTNTDVDKGNAHLWRIPVSYSLNQDVSKLAGVYSTSMKQVLPLNSDNYNHWGDPDHYKYNNVDYILVPITSGNAKTPIIAFFRADNLTFINYAFLDRKYQSNIGWCAINPDGIVFTSRDDADQLITYTIDWNKINNPQDHTALQWKENHDLKNISGDYILHNMQGGEFTHSGELLYISSGAGYCFFNGDGIFPTDGIHVFETSSWTEIKHSTNSERDEMGYFNYTFNNGCNTCGFFGGGAGSHTPEGLTIWDLDDGKAPDIKGQLHVLINFYNDYSLCDDAISFQHFSNKFYTDELHGLPATWMNWTNILPGSAERPFFTLKDAFTWFPAWDGAQIFVKKGLYLDVGKYSTRVKISSSGGAATIGSSGTAIKGVVLYENPGYKGDYRYFNTDVPNLDVDAINFADVTSSVKPYNIKESDLYDYKNYGGKYIKVKQDVFDLRSYGLNDSIGSLKIIK